MKKLTKKQILSHLPNGFKCYVSKTGLTIRLAKRLAGIDDFDVSNKAVSKMAKKLHLEEVGAGTMISAMDRDWELISLDVEKQMKADAFNALKAMKKFFGNWGNAYCESPVVYSVVDQMRDLVATDEN